MKKTIHGKTYDTETAERLITYGNNLPANDFDQLYEQLYWDSTNHRFFIYGFGGARTKYAKSDRDGWQYGSEDITVLRTQEVIDWIANYTRKANLFSIKDTSNYVVVQLRRCQKTVQGIYTIDVNTDWWTIHTNKIGNIELNKRVTAPLGDDIEQFWAVPGTDRAIALVGLAQGMIDYIEDCNGGF